MNTRTKPRAQNAGQGSTEAHLATPPPPFTVYYGVRRFLLVAESFSLDRSKRPYRRLSATLILARKAPVHLYVGESRVLSGRAMLIAPGVQRQNIAAVNSEVAIFDVSIGTPEYELLQPILRPGGVQVLDMTPFAALEPLISDAFHRRLLDDEAAFLFTSAIRLASNGRAGNLPLDKRVRQAMEIIDQFAFDELPPETLASQIGLSASRLRHLFREQLGCPLTRYQRWSATWQATVLMPETESLTELAHQTGFYDLAHFDHAFMDIFGLTPSHLLNASNATLVPCL